MRIDGALGERAYDELHRLISSGSFPPGFAIREVDLVRMLGVSRTPVREALHRLEADGLITPLPGGGYLARELGPKELADIYKVRSSLECLSAREACVHRTTEHLVRMRKSLDEIDRAFRERDEEGFSIRAFFTIVGEASGNEFLSTFLARVNNVFRYRALSLTYPDLFATLRRDIEDLYRGIEARDADAAERAAAGYFEKALARRIEHNTRHREANGIRSVAAGR